MLKLVSNVPRDEQTWDMVQAAFAEVDKIMAERGFSTADIDYEYLRRATDRRGFVESCDGFKALIHTAADEVIEDMFRAIGEPV